MSIRFLDVEVLMGGEVDKNKISGIALTINLFGAKKDKIIDFETLEVSKSKVPLLSNHDPDKVIGWVILERQGDEIIVIDGSLTEGTSLYNDIRANIENKVPYKFSARLSVGDENYIKKGKVNNKNVSNCLVIKNTSITELSLTVIPMDKNTNARILNENQGNKKMTDELQLKLSESQAENEGLILKMDTLTKENKQLVDAHKDVQLSEIKKRLNLADEKVKNLADMSMGDLDLMLDVIPEIKLSLDKSLLNKDKNIGDEDAGNALSVSDQVMRDTEKFLSENKNLSYNEAEMIVLKTEKYTNA